MLSCLAPPRSQGAVPIRLLLSVLLPPTPPPEVSRAPPSRVRRALHPLCAARPPPTARPPSAPRPRQAAYPAQQASGLRTLLARVQRFIDYFSFSAYLSSRRWCRDLGVLLIALATLAALLPRPGSLGALDASALDHLYRRWP